METMESNTMSPMATYPAYKPSGVDWLGDIPEGWQVRKGKWLFVKLDRPVSDSDEIVTCFRDGQVTLRTNRRIEGFTNALKEHGYQGVRKGDLVIHAMDAFAGAIGVSDSDGKSTPVYSICVPRKEEMVSPYFYSYFLRNLAYTGYILSLAKGIRERSTDFRYNDFAELLLPFPPLPEQEAIANFLDEKTAKIDQAIAQKERLIALLKERKQIMIQQAVTKGLDPNAPMKDSGVEWIGDIPEHWEVKRLKYMVDETFSGGTPSTDFISYWNGGLKWISSADVKSIIITETLRNISFLGLRNSSSRLAKNGSLVIVTRSGILQHTLPVAILSDDMAINQDIRSFLLKKHLLPTFLQQFLIGKNHEVLVETRQQGATVESINMMAFINSPIPIPPTYEQIEIVSHVEAQSTQIDRSIGLQEAQIAKLKEYKSVLIDSAVTGKVKVG